ncbi:hypothetical protein RUM43_011019 [Polyplax serrata]|uniref:Fcf2 pre-rRNA processing C-terminal domain-containing protein n=1 Tax=Polyplax serrata TaxID=468196 RepID=A0AAN8NLB1_POLSC
MYDFCVDVTGEDGNSIENVEFETFKGVTHQPSQECEDNSDLFKTLPELKDNSELINKKHNILDPDSTYLITSHRHKSQQKLNQSTSGLMSKSSLKPGLEKEHSIPLIKEKMLKLNRKKLREQTKGEKWYNLPATEVTDEIKNDLQVLQMRSVLDKNHFYKKNDIKNISKYFQFGTVVENSADFYSGRIVKSMRKKTLVDELLADAECRSYQKKKYKEIMDTSRRKYGNKSNVRRSKSEK